MELLEDKVSIIIPVYNSETTIERCIKSALIQTYKNIEVVVIDDGSKDNSLNIIKKFKDTRMKVYSQENSGVSTARNNGLKYSTGDYIIFLDSDDRIEPSCVEVLLTTLKKNKDDLAVCGFLLHTLDNRILQKNYKENHIFSKEDLIIAFKDLALFTIFCAPDCKIFKKRILDNHSITFNEKMSLSEDTCFILDYLKYCSTIEIIQDNLSCKYQQKGSLSTRDRKDILENQLVLYNKYLELVIDRNLADNFLIRSIAIAINTSIVHKWNYKSYHELCKKICELQEFKNIKYKNLYGIKNKVFYILLKLRLFTLIKIIQKRKEIR